MLSFFLFRPAQRAFQYVIGHGGKNSPDDYRALVQRDSRQAPASIVAKKTALSSKVTPFPRWLTEGTRLLNQRLHPAHANTEDFSGLSGRNQFGGHCTAPFEFDP
jgi:hypothetical protein